MDSCLASTDWIASLAMSYSAVPLVKGYISSQSDALLQKT